MLVGNVVALGLVGCGSDGESPAGEDAAIAYDVHPDAMPREAEGSELTAAERDLLARARGRDWADWTAAEVDAFLRPGGDTIRFLTVWDPRSQPGARALGELSAVAREQVDPRTEIVIAVHAGGDERTERIALRESQLALEAVRIPRSGHLASGLPGGEALLAEGSDGAVQRIPLSVTETDGEGEEL